MTIYFVCVQKSTKVRTTKKCNFCIPELELMWLLITDVIIIFLIVNNEKDSGALGLNECGKADGRNLVCILFAYNLSLICIREGKLNTFCEERLFRVCLSTVTSQIPVQTVRGV
jgi:hypothetical protein